MHRSPATMMLRLFRRDRHKSFETTGRARLANGFGTSDLVGRMPPDSRRPASSLSVSKLLLSQVHCEESAGDVAECEFCKTVISFVLCISRTRRPLMFV